MTALRGELPLAAAASLRGAFDELARIFGSEHPAILVAAPMYDGSSTHVTQLGEGAVADVVALADTRTMATAEGAGLVGADPLMFATNKLEIAVAPGNPLRITSPADLARGEVRASRCGRRARSRTSPRS